MKKRILTIFGLLICCALALAGCATVSKIKNTQEGILYNGGNAVVVGDYIYYANAYTPYSGSTEFNYKDSAKISYLARLNISNSVESDGQTSPAGVEKVNKKVAGFENQNMFVYGNYIYFTTMNTHKDKNLGNNYSEVTFMRSKLNGDSLKEIYTTSSETEGATQFSNGSFSALQGSDGAYYWVIYDGKTISSIKLGNKLGARKLLAEDVTSCAMIETGEEAEVKKIYYTKTGDSISSKSDIFAVDYATGEIDEYTGCASGETITLADRVGDKLFFTSSLSSKSNTIYVKNLLKSDNGGYFFNNSDEFYTSSSIKNVFEVCKDDPHDRGLIFVSGNGGVVYKKVNSTAAPTILLTSDDFKDILFVDGDSVYFSNDTGIYKISVKEGSSKKTIVSMTNLISGKYAFDGTYIYFFAQKEVVESEEETEEIEQEEDTNNYMFRVDSRVPQGITEGNEPQLIGKTK